jgi:hypothetical protein
LISNPAETLIRAPATSMSLRNWPQNLGNTGINLASNKLTVVT